MNTGKIISDLREQKGWAQKDLAEKSGISRVMIGKYERGEAVPSIEAAKKIADALETQKYKPGDVIIRQGDPGYSFFLLEAGEADALKDDTRVLHYKKGDFFGELALLNDAPRAASVVASSDVKVATLGKNAFQRLLGPVEGILRRTKYQGVKSGVEDMDPMHTG